MLPAPGLLQAEQLRARAARADGAGWRSGQQLCRYLYYQGRMRAVGLQYSDAKDCLQQAQRKAPAGAIGFRLATAKVRHSQLVLLPGVHAVHRQHVCQLQAQRKVPAGTPLASLGQCTGAYDVIAP